MATFNKLSKIGWTDFSGGCANPVLRGKAVGDCEVSPGCDNCYARIVLARFGQASKETTYSWDKLKDLGTARFKPPFKRGGDRPLVFVCDMGDLFHPAVSDVFIQLAFAIMTFRQDVDWQILTKRPGRMKELVGKGIGANVWLGVTAENQATADERVPILASIPATVRWISVEPMLEPVHFRRMSDLNWVVCGGESGPKRRPFEKAWAIDLYRQCEEAGVSFFFKQASGLRPGTDAYFGCTQIKEWPTPRYDQLMPMEV